MGRSLCVFLVLVLRASWASALLDSEEGIHAKLKGCPITYFVHIPKTAGTALVSVMKRSPHWLQLKRAGIYVGHGRDFGDMQWRQIAVHRRTRNRTIVAEEIGLSDLERRGYPYFAETCFLSTLREPARWLPSAMLHLRAGLDKVRDRRLYFDRENIMTAMTAPVRTPYRAMVLAALERRGAVDTLLGLLDLGVDEDGRPPTLPVANRCQDRREMKPCPSFAPDELASIDALVASRYANDTRLWTRVNRSALGLVLLRPGERLR